MVGLGTYLDLRRVRLVVTIIRDTNCVTCTGHPAVVIVRVVKFGKLRRTRHVVRPVQHTECTQNFDKKNPLNKPILITESQTRG